MQHADDARIAELKRYGIAVFQKTMHDTWGWWCPPGSGHLNGPFQTAAGACKDAFAQIGDDPCQLSRNRILKMTPPVVAESNKLQLKN